MKSCRHLGHIKPLEPWVWWECFRALKQWTGEKLGHSFLHSIFWASTQAKL